MKGYFSHGVNGRVDIWPADLQTVHLVQQIEKKGVVRPIDDDDEKKKERKKKKKNQIDRAPLCRMMKNWLKRCRP